MAGGFAGLAAEDACKQGGCYVGVLPYVYEV